MNNPKLKFFPQLFLRLPYFSNADFCCQNIPSILKVVEFQNAIWLASPILYGTLVKKKFDFPLLNAKERFAVFKYYNRMSYRPTPFGGFSGYALANWSQNAEIKIDNSKTIFHILPSLEWLNKYKTIESSDKNELLVTANSTLYKVGKNWRYLKYDKSPNGKLLFSVRAIEAGRINNYLIKATRSKSVKRNELILGLISCTDCSLYEAEDYLDFLIDQQVIISEIETSLIYGRTSLLLNNGFLSLSKYWESLKDLSISKQNSISEIAEKLNIFNHQLNIKREEMPFYAAKEFALKDGGINPVIQCNLKDAVFVLQLIISQTERKK